MNDLTALLDRMRTQRPVAWDQLPDFALYMDQVLSYMDRQVLRFDEEDALTASMVNNYTKSGLVPRAEGKKYNREHLAYLTAICVLKRVMSTRDMDLLIREELRGERTVEDGYTAFCESLNSALQAMAQEMEARPEGRHAGRRRLTSLSSAMPPVLPAAAMSPCCGRSGPANRPIGAKKKRSAIDLCGTMSSSPTAAATCPQIWPKSWSLRSCL